MARSEWDREQIVGVLQRELEARPEVVLALLHGSFSKSGAYRDIDVAVWLDRLGFRRTNASDTPSISRCIFTPC